ncbi:hypothetical protein DPMN_031640 [Dreissena polymorpha]|uniref:F5/8 type C domain-containing protein n=1 Tax=Dreissena polymorpha TaxID=45954 RepID=A0A9D4M0C8_DREPO|nr:hypothetical protein DPMN_031640 [Dreissena polymorpha]
MIRNVLLLQCDFFTISGTHFNCVLQKKVCAPFLLEYWNNITLNVYLKNLQVELLRPSLIRGVVTQGRHVDPLTLCCVQRTTSYKVSYSNDGNTWTFIQDSNKNDLVTIYWLLSIVQSYWVRFRISSYDFRKKSVCASYMKRAHWFCLQYHTIFIRVLKLGPKSFFIDIF